MRKEHTVSEVTEAEGLTDAQFFYGEIMKLQRKCNMQEQEIRELKAGYHKVDAKLGDATDTIHTTYHTIRDIKSYLSAISTGKLTKANIISRIETVLKNLETTRKELEKW